MVLIPVTTVVRMNEIKIILPSYILGNKARESLPEHRKCSDYEGGNLVINGFLPSYVHAA